jgi:integrase
MLIRSGASVKVIQTRLGHSSAKTTLDTYGHLFPDEQDRTRAFVDAALRLSAADFRGPRRPPDREAAGQEAKDQMS